MFEYPELESSHLSCFWILFLRTTIMGKNGFVLVLIFMVLFGSLSSASAAPPAKIVNGVFSNVISALLKWLWSMKATTNTAISGRPMMKFESGYTVETVFDGSKLGIEPYSVEALPSGELLVVDSVNSNIYKISTPLSRYSRPKLIAGSPEGYSGHVDGKPREARMNHPTGLTVDDTGNIYIADTMNMVIRKISDAGVTTIAGGNWNHGGGGHVDGPSEDARFSNDFDVVYIGSSCSLLVIDRGNQAIREIQLHFDDCAYQYESGFSLGIAVLVAAVFFGYMLALLQRRMGKIVSSQNDLSTPRKSNVSSSPYQRPHKSSVRPPLIPTEDEQEKQEEGLFGSVGRLFLKTGAAVAAICGGLFTGFRRKPANRQQYHQQHRHPNAWPLQESFVIPDEDEPPPSIDTRTPTPRKTYAFMTKDPEKSHHFWQRRAPYYSGWDDDFQQQQQQHRRHYSTSPPTYYEQSCEATSEIVFGAVQEQDGRRDAVVMKAVDYGDPMYNQHNARPRVNYMGYTHAY